MQHRVPTLLSSLAIGITLAGAALVLIGSEAKARPAAPMLMTAESIQEPPNRRIQSTFDRSDSAGKVKGADPAQFTNEIRAFLAKGEIRNGADFALASAVMARGKSLQDSLLSHDLAVCALALGYTGAKSLVASSQDQILARLGQKQRFGTQLVGGKLMPVDGEVSDSMRFIMGIPTIRESKNLIAKGKAFVPKVVDAGAFVASPTAIAVAAPTAVK